MLLESIPIGNPQEAAEKAVRLVPSVHNDPQALLIVIRELCLNVLQWSEGTGNIFVEKDDDSVTLTVLDAGIGIPACMRGVYPDLSNQEAVAMALSEGESTSGQDFRGWGLPSTLALTGRDRFSAYLETEDVAVWMEGGEPLFANKSGGSINGTLVSVAYSTESA